LIELLVVIAIISILSSVVLASINTARNRARVARAVTDLRQLNIVLALYHSANNAYPCFDHTWDDTDERTWSLGLINWPKNPWGLEYHWEHGLQGFTYSISIRSPGSENAQILDRMMDDGILTTGKIKGDGNRVEYGGMDQLIPLNDCHI